MTEKLYQISDTLLFLLITGITLIFSMILLSFIEKCFPSKDRYKENQAVGNVCSIIGLIFAVFSGFAAYYVLNNFNKATEAVQEEANQAMAIYQDAGWLNESIRSQIRHNVQDYLNGVLDEDWPAMKSGQSIIMKTDLEINEMTDNLHKAFNQMSIPFPAQEISKEINALRNAREKRIRLKNSALDPDVWLVILFSGSLTIAFQFAFGMQKYLHMIAVCAVAVVISSMVFLLFVIDHPFEGRFSVSPEPYQYYLDLIKSQENPV